MAVPRRPDPSQGVFETLLVVDGRPVELDAHLARITASLEALFPDRPPPDLSQMDVPVVDPPYGWSTTGTSAGRRGEGALGMRVTVAPDANDSLDAWISLRPVEAAPVSDPQPIALQRLSLPDGLGPHKWADRKLLDEAQAKLPEDTLPLIVDMDGAVLEASRANVFAVRGGSVFTPPTDGRLLPGVTRMRVLKLAAAMEIDAQEAVLTRDDLLTADEVFLTGSVRGIERVESLDGAPLAGGHELTERLATELWDAWAGSKTAI